MSYVWGNMAKFRKKPIEIEAWQFPLDGNWANGSMPDWAAKELMSDGKDTFIPTLEGKLHVSLGDWIIKGMKGEVYPCKPEIFDATYEPVV